MSARALMHVKMPGQGLPVCVATDRRKRPATQPSMTEVPQAASCKSCLAAPRASPQLANAVFVARQISIPGA